MSETDVAIDERTVYEEIFEKVCEELAGKMLQELKERGADAVIQKEVQKFEDGLVVRSTRINNIKMDLEGHVLNDMPLILATSITTLNTKNGDNKSSTINFKMLIEYEVDEDATLKVSKEELDKVLE